jgi:hypothetical protein
MFAADLTACFDRMWPALGNIISGKFGVEVQPMISREKIIAALKRSVQTGHGVSESTYQNVEGQAQARIIGELQGKGDVALIYALQSSTVLTAHATMYQGIRLLPASPGPGIKKCNDGYIDNVNTWSGSMHVEQDEVEYILCISCNKVPNPLRIISTRYLDTTSKKFLRRPLEFSLRGF